MDKTTSLDRHVKSRLQPLSCSVIGSMGAAPREYIIIIQAEFVQKKSGMFVHRYASLTEVLGFEMLCGLT